MPSKKTFYGCKKAPMKYSKAWCCKPQLCGARKKTIVYCIASKQLFYSGSLKFEFFMKKIAFKAGYQICIFRYDFPSFLDIVFQGCLLFSSFFSFFLQSVPFWIMKWLISTMIWHFGILCTQIVEPYGCCYCCFEIN